MAAAMMGDDDKDQSLQQLSTRHSKSIVSQLVDMCNEGNQELHTKFRPFVKSLQCLQLNGTQLSRTSIDAFRKRQYVALSYTWDASEYEDDTLSGYLVQDWDLPSFQPSEVRKCVLDRIFRYMNDKGISHLWIDKHCNHQRDETCEVKGVKDCVAHPACVQHRDAMQAMDLVYQLSDHPVALLGRPMRTESELNLLVDIIRGGLVDGEHKFQRSQATSIQKARDALSLLWKITQDRWWGRAWTFQENYRGLPRMQLLISHDSSLEEQKLRCRTFGKIPGELCVPSVDFSTKATRLCLALRRMAGLLPAEQQQLEEVLSAAGRYVHLLEDTSSMTPTIVADIEARGIQEPWDRLAIIANCCKYPVRLKIKELSRPNRSLSLSTLAMCLLNGEILDNGKDDMESVAGLTMSKYLKSSMFRAFNAPEAESRRLSFNKTSRLNDVRLTVDGIATTGHLWKLGCIIDTARFPRRLPSINEPDGRLDLDSRRRLTQLESYLSGQGYSELAGQITRYLAADVRPAEDSFTKMHLHRMATELAAAIEAGEDLRLGVIWDPEGGWVPYRAAFLWPDEVYDEPHPPKDVYAFTSMRQGDGRSEAHEYNDIDHYYVSLIVDMEEPVGGGAVPRLRIRRWLNGMCFFTGCPRDEVVFPWPRTLQEVQP